MKELIGCTIRGIFVSDDQHFLTFSTSGGPVTYEALGGCCSESWFADITGFDALNNGKVLEVEEIGMDGYNVEDGRGRQSEDEAYGYKLRTDKGYGMIVFRNSSNGYYGGWLGYLPGDTKETTIEITDDWSA